MTLPHCELENIKRELEAKHAELVGHRASEGIIIERTADSMDELVFSNERDMIVERLNREANLLRQIEDALDRIAAGRHGICLECENSISPKRLAALPWAALCLKCQEALDRESGEGPGSIRTPSLLNAA